MLIANSRQGPSVSLQKRVSLENLYCLWIHTHTHSYIISLFSFGFALWVFWCMSLFFKPFSLQHYETWMLQINVGWNNSLLLAAESVVNLTLEDRQQDTLWVLWTTCSQKGVHNFFFLNWYMVKNMDASATRKNKWNALHLDPIWNYHHVMAVVMVTEKLL